MHNVLRSTNKKGANPKYRDEKSCKAAKIGHLGKTEIPK